MIKESLFIRVGRTVCGAVVGGIAGAVFGAALNAVLGKPVKYGIFEGALGGAVTGATSANTNRPVFIILSVIAGTIIVEEGISRIAPQLVGPAPLTLSAITGWLSVKKLLGKPQP